MIILPSPSAEQVEKGELEDEAQWLEEEMDKAGQANDRLKENLIEALKRSATGGILTTANLEDSIDMDSAADKALKIIDKIIYGEKVGHAYGECIRKGWVILMNRYMDGDHVNGGAPLLQISVKEAVAARKALVSGGQDLHRPMNFRCDTNGQYKYISHYSMT